MDVQDTYVTQYTSTILFIIASVLYSLYRWNIQNYWQRVGVPHVKPNWLIGSTLQNVEKTMHLLDVERYNKLGRVHGHFEDNTNLLAVADPKLLKKVFVKDFETFPKRQYLVGRLLTWGDPITNCMLQRLDLEEWKLIRPILSPAFSSGKIRMMIDTIKSCTRTLLENIEATSKKGEAVDLKWYFNAFIMDGLSSALYSIKIKDHNDPNNVFVAFGRSIFHKPLTWKSLIYYAYLRFKFKFMKLSTPEYLKFFTNIAFEAIDERRKTGQVKNDLLQLIMDASADLAREEKKDTKDSEELLNNYEGELTHIGVQKNADSKKLSRIQVAAQCTLFFLAAFETQASCLSYTSYFLSLYPDIQEKLIKELDETLKKCNGILEYEDIQSMKYLDNVISESLRMCTPIIRLTRECRRDYDTGEFIIPKGAVVTVPLYAMHMDPKNFPDPENFDPDRFTPEERAKREPFTYLPFGAGPRHCIGMRFALIKMKLALSYILARYRIKRCPETKVPLPITSWHGLLHSKEVKVALEPRKDAPHIV